MIVYRITDARYPDLDGEGARLSGGRWNQVGFAAIYAASSISLAALETLVHSSAKRIRKSQYLIWTIDIHDNSILVASTERKMPTDVYGTQFLFERAALALKVPSAVIPTEYNYLINPNHPEFSIIPIFGPIPFVFDSRLI